MKTDNHKSFYSVYVKRGFDLLLVILTAPFWVLLCLLVALLVRINLGSPVIFHQPRGGLHCSKFTLLKFRSMTSAKNENGELLPDEVRLTRFGKFLRAASLDELPSIVNVLKGDMSIVGPRPFLYSYVELYDDEQRKRHWVRPGITGWAQVNGRNTISWEEKFEYDVEYVRKVSWWFDLKILWLTFLRVVQPKDVNSSSHATMELFSGTKRKADDHSDASGANSK